MTTDAGWYVIQQPTGHCEIIQMTLETLGSESPTSQAEDSGKPDALEPQKLHQWGPFASHGEAIARRIGLIRSGKCQPL